jgi:hypothetical protein
MSNTAAQQRRRRARKTLGITLATNLAKYKPPRLSTRNAGRRRLPGR